MPCPLGLVICTGFVLGCYPVNQAGGIESRPYTTNGIWYFVGVGILAAHCVILYRVFQADAQKRVPTIGNSPSPSNG
jgi:hypothetical protein